MNVMSQIVHSGGGIAERSTAEPMQVRSGRGPAGNVRSFRAMKTEKFWIEASKVMREANDPEAIRIVGAEVERRIAEAIAS
jgi:hypothetical protein